MIAPPLEMSVEQRGELEVMARSDSLPYRQVRQASALVMAADGAANAAIARAVGVKADTVRAWRARFARDGVGGVGRVAPGRGRKPSIPPEKVEAIVAARWGCARGTVRRIGRRGPWRRATAWARTPWRACGGRGVCARG